MTRAAATVLAACCLAVASCRRSPVEPQPQPREPAPKPAPDVQPKRPKRKPHRLDRKVSLTFVAAPFPDVISRIAKETGVGIGVSPALPLELWQNHTVTLRVADVPLRAVLDWLVRPLQARYAVEADARVWLTRGQDLLLEEELVARSYRVPTHIRGPRPRRGAFSFEREKHLVLATLHDCLRYIERRRPACRLAFARGGDVLTANLPPRGHLRLQELLAAMRYGTDETPQPRPTAQELNAKLLTGLLCDWRPGPLDKLLVSVAERAGLNLGWDARRVGSPIVLIPSGKHTVRFVLAAVARQTRIGRYHVEPGHGIWLNLDGEDFAWPASAATPWDRAFVHGYDVRRILASRSPTSILDALHAQVDPGQWRRGLPAASVFLPTGRLIVVHDAHGHRRVRSLLAELAVAPVRPKQPAKGREPKRPSPARKGP